LQELGRRGVVDTSADTPAQTAQLLSFFQVANPAAYDRVWSGQVASGFRRAKTLQVDPFATAAWLRLAELEADSLDTATYSQELFVKLLPTLRYLTQIDSGQDALLELQSACASVGVAVVFVPEVKGSRACGAARWPRPSNPMIVLSGRYQYADSLWFSFFHEAAHVVLHAKRETYIHLDSKGDDEDGLETEADRFAMRHLVGQKVASRLRSGLRFSDVRALAEEAGVHAGIVAGQLSHALNDYRMYAKLRRKITLPGSD
jgi:HTH-type transcriptional regulator/antitoxin HigA